MMVLLLIEEFFFHLIYLIIIYSVYLCQEIEATAILSQNNVSQPVNSHLASATSISMPSSPMEVHLQNTKRVLFSDHGETRFSSGIRDSSATSKSSSNELPRQAKFHSQPMPTGSMYPEALVGDIFPNQPELQARNPRIGRLKDKRFDSFKTWSGKLERQLSTLRGKPQESEQANNNMQTSEIEILPVDRYFDALEGPELDTLKVCVSL